jgi:PAT family beta-lactamase induction signal transducer AmpG
MVATIVGAFIGGWVTTLVGLGHSLWVFGFLQIFSNIGYYFLAAAGGVNLPLMYGATSFELLTGGLGTGAFSVLLLRMTQKRFSATQYALFTSLFALPRLLAGPIAGFAVDAIGWGPFYLSTLFMGIPGLIMLSRFVPLGVREPEFSVEPIGHQAPLGARALTARALAGGLLCGISGLLVVALLAALKTMREAPDHVFDFPTALWQVVKPATIPDWVQLAGILAFAVVGGLFVAAIVAARHGAAAALERSGNASAD